MKSMYYDGTKLLSLSDINGNKPEIYICTSNRTGGKTTYFNRLVVKRFFRNKSKFMLLYRYNYELDDVADKFFKDIGSLFFPDYFMRSEKRAKGVYHNLFICNRHIEEDLGEHCGYAVSINNADQIKKMSHLFSDTDIMLFDEFQPESDVYCPNEVKKFISVHTSVARGQGEMTRYLPVIMISNPVSIINPYYTKLNISHRLKADTKFLRGKGFVLEQGWIETAARAMQESAFSQAFEDDKYIAYASQNIYLNDNYAFIEPPSGNSKYMCTILYMDKNYAIRTCPSKGIVYCDNKADLSYPYKISVTTEDHRINYVMLEHNDLFISGLRRYFNKGCFRFRNLECKEAAIALVCNR